ncbi:MAG: fused MFS/spermidine synthase [Planctomycetes bacterium]|nr:fused MFS/spermidine synthase [Planctomycetota bacterium]
MSEEGGPPAATTPAPGRPGGALLLAAVACSGAAVMTVEMTAVRALQPFFGSTTFVWTNVIAVVLAALALGYEIGGRLADRRPAPVLLFGLMAGGGVLVAAAALGVRPVAGLFLAEGVDLAGLLTVLVKGSLGATLLLFAPPLLLLGMVSPLAIRLLAERGVGRAAGRVFAVSTLGSIAGTYLPTMLLVPALGSRGSLLAAAGMLILPAAAGLLLHRRGGAAAAAVLLGAALGVPAVAAPLRPAPPLADGGTSRLLEERESDLQYLAVREDAWPGEPPRRVLCINEGVYTYHALRVEGRVLTEARPYDDYSLIPFLLDLPPGAVLRAGVLGYACGVDAGQWRHFWEGPYRVEVLGAEIDGEVLALGRERFGAPEEPGVAEADGRPWLEALPEGSRMHFLVIDAFARELYVPFHLATREFFALCRRRLEPGGILAMNVYAVGASSPHLAALENTMASVFGSCLRASQHGGTNFLLLARNGEGPADLGRLGRAQARARFGERPGTAEWERLLDHGAALAADAAVVVPRGDLPVLTDDDAPLEWMTDRFLRENEDRILADAGDSVAELRRLDRRQSWLLAGIALLGLGAGVILNPAQIIKRWAAPTRAGSGIGRA